MRPKVLNEYQIGGYKYKSAAWDHLELVYKF